MLIYKSRFREAKITTPAKQKQLLISLGVDESNLSYYGKGKTLYPVIDLKTYKNEKAGLSDFEVKFDENTTYYCSILFDEIRKKGSTYFFGYFGGLSGKQYEYCVVSESIQKVYDFVLNDYDYNEVFILGINFSKKRFINIEGSIHDDYSDFDDYFKGF